MNKVSLIIPVYNVEKYLRQCLESVAVQTFKDIEVIIIDNNSPDNSAAIIKEYVEKYPNFKTYKLIGGGLGGARNEGIRHATGEYVVFLDSDDYIKPNTIEELVKAVQTNSADMAGGLADDVDINGKVLRSGENPKENFIIDNKKDGPVKMLQIVGNIACAWRKIIRRSIIADNNIFFPENVPFEDVAFISTCAILSNKYVQIPLSLWNYRYVPTSISNTKGELGPKSHFNNFAAMRKFLKQKGIYKDALAEEWEYTLLKMIIGGESQGNGGLKKLSEERVKEFFTVSRDFYITLPKDFFKNRNLVFKLKFKLFVFALSHNFYNMHKYTRPLINTFANVYLPFTGK